MKTVIWAVALAGALAAGASYAQSGAELAKAKGCMNCHELDKKKVGPSFKDIAAKHSGNAAAAGAIIAKLKDGKGHPKAAATDAEIKTLVEYALSAK